MFITTRTLTDAERFDVSAQVSSGVHYVVSELFGLGFRFGDDVPESELIRVVDNHIGRFPAYSRSQRLSMRTAVATSVKQCMSTFPLHRDWELLSADRRVSARSLMRPDFVYCNPEGFVIADEIKFGSTTNLWAHEVKQQCAAYADLLGDIFGDAFKGIRVLVNNNISESAFMHPSGRYGCMTNYSTFFALPWSGAK